MKWRLHYTDGSTFSDEDGSWREAPAEGVQILEEFGEPPYRNLTYGVDTYRLPGRHSAKHGRWMADDEWESLRKRVVDAG